MGIDNGTGSFVIQLASAVTLREGRQYWVSVQVNMDFGVGGEWGWETRNTKNGRPAAWRNPGDGFGTGCTTYAVESVCIGGGPDHMSH